jgi:hypothetical protein
LVKGDGPVTAAEALIADLVDSFVLGYISALVITVFVIFARSSKRG